MNNVLLLSQLSGVQNLFCKQIRLCFCKTEDMEEITSTQSICEFSDIEEFYGERAEKYKVLRIDTWNNILSVYVIKYE